MPTRQAVREWIADNRASISPGAFAQHNDSQGHTQNFEVKNKIPICNIMQIIFMLVLCVFDGRPVPIINLCPTRDARFEIVPSVIARDHKIELFYKNGAFGPRSDHTHFTPNHIE